MHGISTVEDSRLGTTMRGAVSVHVIHSISTYYYYVGLWLMRREARVYTKKVDLLK